MYINFICYFIFYFNLYVNHKFQNKERERERKREEEGRRERGRAKDVRCAAHAKSPRSTCRKRRKERRVSLFSQEPRIIPDWKLNRGTSVSRKPSPTRKLSAPGSSTSPTSARVRYLRRYPAHSLR